MNNFTVPTTVMGITLERHTAELTVAKLVWRPSAYGVIFNERGEVLILDNRYNGKREMPGGGVEIWESLRDGVAREVWEETGLVGQAGALVHIEEAFFLTPSGKQWHTLQHFFYVAVEEGIMRDSIIEGEDVVNPHYVDPTTLTADNMTIGWDALQIALAAR